MRKIRLQIDISGTVGAEAWGRVRQFSEIDASHFGPDEGASGPCLHSPGEPHLRGEWWGAVVSLENDFLAEYALPHYLEQARVMDAYIEREHPPPP